MTNNTTCSICDKEFPEDELKEADDFDAAGNHRYLYICEMCEKEFDDMNITFNFKNDPPL